MTASTYRLITALLALTLLAGACTLGRSRSSAARREQPTPASLTADIETLRHENAQLREQQQAMRQRMAEVQQQQARSQEEQRRFRESMTTNFDLLEQSVALTLSKTITADLGSQPARPAPQRPVQPIVKAEVPAPQTMTAPQAMTAPAAEEAPQPVAAAVQPLRETPAVALPVAPTHGAAAAVVPVAMRSAESRPEEPLDDPDLLPPQSPRQLSAHQEAKPLYEKGFALFARKEYDQAIIVFQNFLNRFPDDIYSDNAQFWIAESYLSLNRSVEADDAYRAVLRGYEHRSTLEGYKTPDAILRLGQIAQRRGDVRRARHYYEVVGERFPDSSAGRKAQRELASQGVSTAAR